MCSMLTVGLSPGRCVSLHFSPSSQQGRRGWASWAVSLTVPVRPDCPLKRLGTLLDRRLVRRRSSLFLLLRFLLHRFHVLALQADGYGSDKSEMEA